MKIQHTEWAGPQLIQNCNRLLASNVFNVSKRRAARGNCCSSTNSKPSRYHYRGGTPTLLSTGAEVGSASNAIILTFTAAAMPTHRWANEVQAPGTSKYQPFYPQKPCHARGLHFCPRHRCFCTAAGARACVLGMSSCAALIPAWFFAACLPSFSSCRRTLRIEVLERFRSLAQHLRCDFYM